MADKQKIISDIYNDKSGFSSKKVTLEDAKKNILQSKCQMLKNSLEKMLR